MTENKDPAATPPFDGTLAALLRDRAGRYPDRILLTWEDTNITTGEVASAALAFAANLRGLGVGPGDPVLTMVDAGPMSIALFLGLSQIGATWVPQAPDAQGPSLAHVLATVKPVLVIAAAHAVDNLNAVGHDNPDRLLELDGWTWTPPLGPTEWPAGDPVDPDTLCAVLFTSGTTGPPKGVMVTDRMLLASAAGCAYASTCEPEDVFVMWEPMHHVGGPQLVLMALVHGARLIVVKRFSASGFWPLVRCKGVTKLHYLGGILEILLKAMPHANDRKHSIKLAFGGGCRPETRKQFLDRFSIPIREVFGMTEASSFTTVDDRQTPDSIGQVLPWMEIQLRDEDGRPVRNGAAGEITVRPCHPGLLTPGYLGNHDATARLLKGGWLFSGDMARRDPQGNYHFLGRKTDSLRRRGENISAWEVETALAAHPDIAETAILGVPSEIGEADILCFVLMRDGCMFDPARLSEWCQQHMPRHHVPRYWKQVGQFERTPSERIRKECLDKSLADATDLGGEPT